MAQIYVAIQDLESWGALEGFMKPSILKTNGRCNNSSMSTQVPILKSQENHHKSKRTAFCRRTTANPSRPSCLKPTLSPVHGNVLRRSN